MDSTWNFTPCSKEIDYNDGNMAFNYFNRGGDLNAVTSQIEEFSNDSKLMFKTVTHHDMKRIWNIMSLEPGRTTDFSYGGLLMWVNYFNYEYAIYRNTLFIKGLVENDRRKLAFSLPVGEMSMGESVDILKKYCEESGIPLIFSAVPEYAVEELRDLGAVSVDALDDWSDYLYEAESLAYLRGKKNSKKRNHVNQFVNNYPDWQLKEISAVNIDDVKNFMDKYDPEGDNTPMACAERELTRYLIDCLGRGDSQLKGVVLMTGKNDDSEICAVSIADLKGDTMYVHVEKALREFSGSYEMINKAFAERMLSQHPEIKYINREDDAGDPGLRKAKESYHPLLKLKKYNVRF